MGQAETRSILKMLKSWVRPKEIAKRLNQNVNKINAHLKRLEKSGEAKKRNYKNGQGRGFEWRYIEDKKEE